MRTRKLHKGFGLEVFGTDLLTTSPQQIDELRDALDEYQLLVFRCGRKIEPERHVEIASWFGPPVDDHRTGDYWMLLHNDKSAGRDKLPFHSDFTWTDVPVKRISLHALELPPGGTTTSFVSGIHGWETLPQELQERLSPMLVRHRHFAGYYGQEPIEFLADHPLRFAHPRTGRPILFITEFHAHHVHGMEPKESEKILADLRAHLYTPDQVYEHQWKQHDLLIWDNLAVQHARKAEAKPADGPRIMQRVAINETPFIDLVARAREVDKARKAQRACRREIAQPLSGP